MVTALTDYHNTGETRTTCNPNHPPTRPKWIVSYGKQCTPKSSGMCRNPSPTSKIQPHRQLQLSWSKRSCRLHETRRLLKISRIVGRSRLLRVFDELARRIIEAVVGQPQPLVVAIHHIERLPHQLQMTPSA